MGSGCEAWGGGWRTYEELLLEAAGAWYDGCAGPGENFCCVSVIATTLPPEAMSG